MEEILKLINFPLVVSSAVGFVLLWLLLKKTMWGPVLQTIDERRDSIEQAFAEVDAARSDVARMKSEYEARMAAAGSEIQARLQEAVEQGQKIAAEIRQTAEEQREKLLAKTQEDIQREKEKALSELRTAAIDLSFDITRRVLKEDLNREHHEKLVAGFINDLQGLPQ